MRTLGGWATFDNGEVVHIIPMNDLRLHRLDGTCWCHPVEDEEIDTITHNSADGRESYEEGRALH